MCNAFYNLKHCSTHLFCFLIFSFLCRVHFYALDLVNQANVLIWLRNGILFISAFIVASFTSGKINQWHTSREKKRTMKGENDFIVFFFRFFSSFHFSVRVRKIRCSTNRYARKTNTHSTVRSSRQTNSFTHASDTRLKINIIFVAINSFLVLQIHRRIDARNRCCSVVVASLHSFDICTYVF